MKVVVFGGWHLRRDVIMVKVAGIGLGGITFLVIVELFRRSMATVAGTKLGSASLFFLLRAGTQFRWV